MNRVAVCFLRSVDTGYGVIADEGDVLVLDEEVARRLIQEGLATVVETVADLRPYYTQPNAPKRFMAYVPRIQRIH